MSWTYEVSTDEYMAWALTVVERGPTFRRSLLVSRLFAVVLVIAICGAVYLVTRRVAFAVAPGALLLVSLADGLRGGDRQRLRAVYRRRLERWFAANPPSVGTTTLQFSDDGVAEGSGTTALRFGWGDVRALTETEQHLFIEFAGSACVVPAFADGILDEIAAAAQDRTGLPVEARSDGPSASGRDELLASVAIVGAVTIGLLAVLAGLLLD